MHPKSWIPKKGVEYNQKRGAFHIRLESLICKNCHVCHVSRGGFIKINISSLIHFYT